MILTDIRDYIKDRKMVSLGDLNMHFRTSPDEMRGMLGQWIKKGKVIKHKAKAGGCHGCKLCACHDNENLEVYEWNK